MDSRKTAENTNESASDHGETTVKPIAPLQPQGFQARPQGPPPPLRNSINNGPIGIPRPGPPLRRLDSRSSLGQPASGQFVQLRPYGPPRPPGGSFPPRLPQPGQIPPQNPLYPPNQRFAHPPLIRGPLPQAGHRPPFTGNHQQVYQAQQQARFQRPPPDIAPQNGPPPPPRNAEAAPYRPVGQESAFPRQLVRNDSALSLQRQYLLSNEELKQPIRPRIVIEKMADVNETGDGFNKPEGYPQGKKSNAREHSENDDDDDVVMDNERSSRRDANDAPKGLTNGSKSPLTPKKRDDESKSVSRPGTASTGENVEDEKNLSSRPISADKIENQLSKELADDATSIVSQSRPSSESSNGNVREKDEKLASRPASNKVDHVGNFEEDFVKGESGVKSPLLDDSKNNQTPRSASVTSETEETKKSNDGNEGLGNVEYNSKTPSRSSDISRSSTPLRSDVLQDVEQESKTPLKTPDGSRPDTPLHPETPEHTKQESLKTPIESPDKSRSSTPGLQPARNAKEESREPSKTPDKSRSSTPADAKQSSNAEMELKTPTETPDKSRSNTPGLQPARNAEEESREPSKTPDKSRSSTPADAKQSSNAEKELKTPAETPDKSRSNTPAEIESTKDEIGDGHETPLEDAHHDKSDEKVLQVKESSRPASSLDSPNSIIGRDSKSPRSPTTPENQDKLLVPGSAVISRRSSDEGVKGFDNGQQRSLSSRASPIDSPRPFSSPKSPGDSAEVKENEEVKKMSFAEDLAMVEKTVKIAANEIPTSTPPRKPTTLSTKRRAETSKPNNVKTESSEKEAIRNGTGEANMIPTTNGDAELPIKKSPSKSKDVDKSSNAESPTKSPSKSAKSLPRTPETPTSTALDKKKLPMNKIQVGAAPSPNLKVVRSKIGSLDNASYKPGGGKIKIENRKLDFSKAQPKIAAKNDKYTPSGGDKKISQVKLQWNAKSKIGSLENTTHKPGGGDKKIETVKLDFKDKAKSKVGSKDNSKHVPGGGAIKSATSPKTTQEAKNNISTQKIDIKAESKIGSLDNVKHKPGGGDKKIFNDKDYLRQTSSNIESLNGSGSQAQTRVRDDRQLSNDISETPQPQPPPSTPTRTRRVTSPMSIVTPRAIRSGLAKSPEATTPKKQFIEEKESSERHAFKTPAFDATNGVDTSKNRSSKSPTSPSSSGLHFQSASNKSSPSFPRKTSPKTPIKTPPTTPREMSSKEVHFPKLASSPIPQEAHSVPENHSKITLPKLIESSSQSSRMAY